MPHLLRWSALWIGVGVLCAGCNGTITRLVPPPTNSPSPPNVTGVGTLGVVNISNRGAKRVWVFPPNSDQFRQELLFHGSQYELNSVAFDGRGHLYIGFNNTKSGGSYGVVEVNLHTSDVIREMHVAQWPSSSVATDDHDNLYLNTKAFIGGDINLYGSNKDTKPYARIKNHRSPMTMTVAASLWVGYEGIPNNAIGRYRLRSTDETWFKAIGDDVPVSLAPNADGTLLAAFVKRKSGGRAVDVYDVKSGNRARTLLHENNLSAMTTDNQGHIYVAETGRQGVGNAKIHACTFRGCSSTFPTSSLRAIAMAVSPLDGMLYVTMDGKPSVQVFDPKTGHLARTIIMRELEPTALAIEP